MNKKALLLAVLISLSPAGLIPENHCQQKSCQVSPTGLAVIRNYEGYSPFVYKDAAGHPTIGFGHKILPGEKFKEPLLPLDAERLLVKDSQAAVKAVRELVKVRLEQTQADALVSFTYNVGRRNFANSTLLKLVNQERHDEVPAQFMRWVYVKKKPMLGLKVRRELEATLYQYIKVYKNEKET